MERPSSLTNEPRDAPPDPVTSEPFPREELTALLGRAEAARERRERAQTWLVGLGLAILALGLPSERLWGDMELVRMTAGNGERSTGIVFPLAVALTKLLGTGAEQACFLIAALCYGLALPAMVALLRTIGFAHPLALASATTALVAPTVWLGATQPADYAPGVLGATLLLRTLFQPRERVASGYQWRATMLFALAFLLRPENALLFPAVAWAVSRRRGKAFGPLPGLVLAFVTGVALLVQLGPDPLHSQLGADLLDTLLAGRGPSLAALPGWGLHMAGLGLGLFGLYALLLGRRMPEETPAPKWMVPWCLVVLAPVAAGSAAHGPVGSYLVPAAAVGLADWLTRRDREEGARRLAALFLGAQVLLAVAAAVAWTQGDPLREWRTHARRVLEPEDVVVADDARAAYLLEHRFGLETLPRGAGPAPLPELPRDVADALARGERRLVLAPVAGDPWPPQAVLHPALDVWVLAGGELRRVAAGAAHRR